MPVVPPEKLVKLQQQGEGIRNICILAHVDHGKTSLTDALIATNGIISPKLAGKIRYLDSRPDEQLRGITMESSAISLYFSLLRRNAPEAEPERKEYLINLIDSPGHIDFSSEVSTASRLCDGAVVLVDAVEGVCSQTVTVLRQTWLEKLRPLLVINKMDRLITELKLSPSEAYTHLSKLLEQVNAVVGSFALGERMEDDLRWRERIDEKVTAAVAAKGQHAGDGTNGVSKGRKASLAEDDEGLVTSSTPAEYEEKEDEDIYFEPERNNVIFSSAIDGWAFTPRQFAGLYEKKLGIKRHVLEKVLWGDFYLDPKTKRILGPKHLKGRHLKPMFVQLVLEQVWAVYEATLGGPNKKGDPVLLEKITKGLNLSLPAHVMRSKDPKALLSAVFSAWLPLSTALLVSVVEQLPNPPTAQQARLPALLAASPGAEHIDAGVRDAMTHFKPGKGQPVVAYVSKMVSVPESELPVNKRRGGMLSADEARELGRKKRAEIEKAQAQANGNADVASVSDAFSSAAIGDADEITGAPEPEPEPNEDPEHLIGFARLFSGTLTVGDEVYVLPPKYTPARPHAHPQPRKVKITALYLLMGRSLESLDSVPAGNLVGIAGLEGAILKSGTICSQLEGAPNLSSTNAISKNAPIVRVALEPAFPGDLDKMIRGLRLLEQADPAVLYEQLESGEHVICTAGELHLERCLKDLRERFAKCDIQAGEAIVPYRESIVRAEEMNAPRDPALGRGRVEGVTTSKQVTIKLRVRPLPVPVTEFLVKHTGAVKRLYSERKAQDQERASPLGGDGTTGDALEDTGEQDIDAEDTTAEGGHDLSLAEFKQRLADAFAEEKTDKDVWKDVVDKIAAFGPRRVGPNVLIDLTEDNLCEKFLREEHEAPADNPNHANKHTSTFADKVAYAFQLATHQGPLCSEPLQGIAVFLESLTIHSSPEESAQNIGRLTGETIRTTRDAIRSGFLDWSPRLLLALYSCEIQASAEVLGRVYGVISRRGGRIVSESLPEPSTNFTILALLPVAESFGFSDEIRQRTSGFAAPQLVFEGFEMLDEDPFWVPTTEEELEDLGEKADRENVAKRYVDKVRARKGLVLDRKVVESAEKQKTLKR
ncbi:Cytoplasmic GTPase/eEF2-like protein (ribosomal biogenesis) [Friedmanniomyces endolithicus]|uniref:Elongation factor-like 1 n=1 Tax=Friedmanniomyces endolithicus TaxID=329885 RepID=A0AAN6K9A2_9PEZI|nr:Cytoplasmic GTPase/eEF2-like protein (ribosomal biogenesis) [Friedmanniomyces endolithicus]KAK0283111.1 Cytoplasmic GTPase/eEF2-like protein (ribosomal biogenesis) [Friedmanniomyces endolithicus]KAK0326061.1 Cytoplasmic GTPase/eEF2-like protein (ribosomal biogenesis) [Friedmanniomyces endolithicus]KAK0967313.1 Cytoplasmic GTPase/eEF2-like protein (ribosomal biogenesis) [Friedmanniomyces endolithicus]KAK0970961.1 Cytoplasmic GTPase/eEF2-like protein (ribosomal biogenesis) [Friedmanniomyces en